MSTLRVVGVDPGPVPGIVVLDLEEYADESPGRWLRESYALQCTANAAPYLVTSLLNEHSDAALVQVETFVASNRTAKVAHAGASRVTRDLVGQLREVVESHHRGPISGQTGTFVQRSAGAVKPWASTERLAKARLLEPTKGMAHARDAARHALFAAVHDGGLVDPLSSRWSA